MLSKNPGNELKRISKMTRCNRRNSWRVALCRSNRLKSFARIIQATLHRRRTFRTLSDYVILAIVAATVLALLINISLVFRGRRRHPPESVAGNATDPTRDEESSGDDPMAQNGSQLVYRRPPVEAANESVRSALTLLVSSEIIPNASVPRSSDTTRKSDPYDWTGIRYMQEEPDLCRLWRPDLYALIYVHTAPTHFKERGLIRRTYGDNRLNKRLRHATVFIVGRAEDERVTHALALESQRYRDIVQVDFLDTYRNLSIKALAAFSWVIRHCSNVTYVIKVDDDVFINVFNLIRFLKMLITHDSGQENIHCLVWDGMEVVRQTESPWFVKPVEYRDDSYPRYCSGTTYFLRRHLVNRLLDASLRVPFLWVDDAYVTGILAKEANISHNSISSIVSLEEQNSEEKIIEGDGVFAHMPADDGMNRRHYYWNKVIVQEQWTPWDAAYRRRK